MHAKNHDYFALCNLCLWIWAIVFVKTNLLFKGCRSQERCGFGKCKISWRLTFVMSESAAQRWYHADSSLYSHTVKPRLEAHPCLLPVEVKMKNSLIHIHQHQRLSLGNLINIKWSVELHFHFFVYRENYSIRVCWGCASKRGFTVYCFPKCR